MSVDFQAKLARIVDAVHASCAYCGSRNVRQVGEAFTYRGKRHEPDFICERCFVPQDDGPCFDDLPRPWEVKR